MAWLPAIRCAAIVTEIFFRHTNYPTYRATACRRSGSYFGSSGKPQVARLWSIGNGQ
jgi:hypothetical protein